MNPHKKLPAIYAYGNVALFIYSVTSIFYLLPSGTPQLTDYFMVLSVIIYGAYAVRKEKWSMGTTHISLLLFVGLTFSTNLIHYLFYPDQQYILSSLYYVYNAGVFILVAGVARYDKEKTKQYLYVGIAAAILIEALYIQLVPTLRGTRITGTFWNPNQLAVWGLLAFSILVLIKEDKKFTWFDYVLIGLMFYIQTLAVSRAGMVCFMIVMIAALFTNSISRNVKYLLIMCFSILGLVGIYYSADILDKVTRYENLAYSLEKLEGIGQENDDTLEARGYDRIFENPEYLLLGAGEGAYFKYRDDGRNLEMHSSLGTIVFSYGIFGLGLFMVFLYQAFRQQRLIYWVLMGNLLLYGLTHQNIRFTTTWVFIGLCYAFRPTRSRQYTPSYAPAPSAGFSQT